MQQEKKPPAARDARASVRRAAEIVRRSGRAAAADLAESLLDAPIRAGTVVVVGEVKRGKSSLINGLVGHRDLLPVDVLTCTSAPIRVTVTTREETPVPHARIVRGDHRESVPVEGLDRWVTQHRIDGEEEPPTSAELTVGCDELAGVTVVDTPGVGGLDEHAVRAALTEARHAGLLLMVCDASSPITAPEMDILAQARESVGGVVVAVTKTDKNVRRWRDIVADDRRLIREHLGVEVPVIGVSSLRAVDAAEHPDPARRAEISGRVGLTALRDEIRASLTDPVDLGVRAALESVSTTLRSVRAVVAEDLRLYTGTSDAVAELERERARLESFREQSGEWEQLFQRDMQITRNAVTDALDRDLEALRSDWTHRINSEGLRVLRSRPQVFTSQIEVELGRLMENTVGALLQDITRHAEELFPDNPEITAEITAGALASLTPQPVAGRDVEKKTRDLLDPSVMMMGVVGAGVLTTIIPVAPLAGATWIGVNMVYRAMRNGKQHLVTWLRETIVATRMSTTRMLDTVITTTRTDIMLRHRSLLRTRQKELQVRIEEARKAVQDSETQRQERVGRLRRNAEIIDTTLRELAAHLAQLEAAGAGKEHNHERA